MGQLISETLQQPNNSKRLHGVKRLHAVIGVKNDPSNPMFVGNNIGAWFLILDTVVCRRETDYCNQGRYGPRSICGEINMEIALFTPGTQGGNGYTFVNRSSDLSGDDVPLINGNTVGAIAIYATNPTGLKAKIVKKNSAGNYNVLVDVLVTGTATVGWQVVTLEEPFTIPATGDYYVAAYFPASGTMGTLASQPRSYANSDVVGFSQTLTEDTSPLGAVYAVYIENFDAPFAELIPLIPKMTSATTPSGVVTASSNYNTYDPYFAFSQTNALWITSDGTHPQHIAYESAIPITPTHYLIITHSTLAWVMTAWELQGSNDDWSTHDVLDTQTAQGTAIAMMYAIDPAAVATHKSHRIYITAGSATFDCLYTWQLYKAVGPVVGGTQVETPSAFTLTSSADGLTHTINVTGPEGAVYVIHDASHNIVASGIDGEKVRGLTAGTNYHCHARK